MMYKKVCCSKLGYFISLFLEMSVQSKRCVHSHRYTGLGKCRLKVARSQTLKVKISRKKYHFEELNFFETFQIDFVLKISSGRREIINQEASKIIL